MRLYDATMNEDGSVRLSSGTVLPKVHEEGTCLGEHCPVHHPSEHEYRNEPLDMLGKHMVRLTDDGPVIDPDDYLFNRNGYAILVNRVQCYDCTERITSERRWDYVTCSCGRVSVDGGQDYQRRAVRSGGMFAEQSLVYRRRKDNGKVVADEVLKLSDLPYLS